MATPSHLFTLFQNTTLSLHTLTSSNLPLFSDPTFLTSPFMPGNNHQLTFLNTLSSMYLHKSPFFVLDMEALRTRIGSDSESPTPTTKDGKFPNMSFPDPPLLSITLFPSSIANKLSNTLSLSHIQTQTLFSPSTTPPHLASLCRANPPAMFSLMPHQTLPTLKLFLFSKTSTCSSPPRSHRKEPLFTASGNTPRAPSSSDPTRPLHCGIQILQAPTRT